MKPITKLRRYISISLVGIILVMIVTYSSLVYYSLDSILEEVIWYEMSLMAQNFAKSYLQNPAVPLPKNKYLNAYLGPQGIPSWIRNNLDLKSLSHNKLVMGNLSAPHIQNGQVFCITLAYDLHDNNRLYLIETYQPKDDLPEIHNSFERSMHLALGLGIGFILIVGFALRYFFYKISTPINALTAWANKLSRENLQRPHPDFNFEEINQLAGLIRNAVGDLNQALNREHNFLRNASHELRTPIAVIRTNMDLLVRLRPEPEDKEKTAHDRVRRAVDNMHRLTETLLWLSRKEETMPSPESINISVMVKELVRENQYLLHGKKVDLTLETTTAVATLPRAALYIVLGNLIRNAFQYTDQGNVKIRVDQAAITISNIDQAIERSYPTSRDYGFGVGLVLVEQITQKLNLGYKNRPVSGGHEVVLFLTQPDTCQK